jgi:uncharacterized membrane protein YgaE (UPF0421/DUF939 family)
MTWVQFDGVGGSLKSGVSKTTGTVGNSLGQGFDIGGFHISLTSPWVIGAAIGIIALIIYVTRR